MVGAVLSLLLLLATSSFSRGEIALQVSDASRNSHDENNNRNTQQNKQCPCYSLNTLTSLLDDIETGKRILSDFDCNNNDVMYIDYLYPEGNLGMGLGYMYYRSSYTGRQSCRQADMMFELSDDAASTCKELMQDCCTNLLSAIGVNKDTTSSTTSSDAPSPSPGCVQNRKARFYTGKTKVNKKGQIRPKKKQCKWLEKAGTWKINKYCGMTDSFDLSWTSVPPARDVCFETCNSCPSSS